MTQKFLVVLSGGQDSTTCLHWALSLTRREYIRAVTFDYGQRHSREINAARLVAHHADVEHEIVTLGAGILKGTSPLVSDAPLETYASADVLPGGLEKTFVPMRNQLFLTIAANRAYVAGCNNIVTGVCEADSGGYPDCRRDFIDAFAEASSLGTFTGDDGAPDSLLVHTPLMRLSKADSVRLAVDLGFEAYYALALTHTAYDGAFPPVSKDHANLLRERGFRDAGVPDPLVLLAVFHGLMPMPEEGCYGKAVDLLNTPQFAVLAKAAAYSCAYKGGLRFDDFRRYLLALFGDLA